LVVLKNIEWFEKKEKAAGKEEPASTKKGALAPAGKKAEADITLPLLQYLEAPNPDTCLVLTMRGALDKRRKLAAAIQKTGRLIECATPKDAEKDNWLKERFQAAGLKAERSALAHISVNCANLSQLAAEADKLILFSADKGEITVEDALALVSPSSQMSVFELTDAAAAKDAPKACACYKRLLRQGEEEQKIFALLASQFRNLLLTQDMQQQGLKQPAITKELGLHPYVAEKYAAATRNFSRRQLIKALEILLAADIAQKSGRGEMADLLETAILRICAR
jgi:DNA polymerase-3 subunit delta